VRVNPNLTAKAKASLLNLTNRWLFECGPISSSAGRCLIAVQGISDSRLHLLPHGGDTLGRGEFLKADILRGVAVPHLHFWHRHGELRRSSVPVLPEHISPDSPPP
jgi:hypothetical protein